MAWQLKNDTPLPDWAEYKKDTDGMDKIIVDSAKAFPTVLRELGGQRDQYWVTVAQFCIIQQLKEIGGDGTYIKFAANEGSEKYRLAVLPPGKGDGAGQGDALFIYDKLKEKRRLAAL